MYLYPLLVVGCLLLVRHAYAICPICIIAIGAGVGIVEEFGVDDTIIGLWIGALIISTAWWTVNWLIKKNWCFKGCDSITFLSYYILTLVPLYYSGLIGKELNKLWGIDKLLLGVVLGTLSLYISVKWYLKLKAENGGRAHFSFQKIVMTVGQLLLLSVVFYCITR